MYNILIKRKPIQGSGLNTSSRLSKILYRLLAYARPLCFVIFAHTTAIAADVTDDFSTNSFIDTTKTTANWSVEEQAVYFSWATAQQHRLPDSTTAGTVIGSETDITFSVALADIDGDGDLDLVAGKNGTNKLYLNDVTLNGSGNGGFTTGTGTAIGSESDDTRSVTLADVDGDGDIDLVTGNQAATNKLYLNLGSGVFTTGAGTAIGSESDKTRSVMLADVDGDGDLDLVTGNSTDGGSNGTNKLYINLGSGVFTAGPGTAIGGDADNTIEVTLGDVDGDGDLDLVAGNYNQTNKLYLYDGNLNGPGSGGFTTGAGTTIGSESDKTFSVTLGDIDGDGDLDLVTGNLDQTNKRYLNLGSGVFTTGIGTAIGNESDDTWSVTLGDIDGDGDLDLMTGNDWETNKLYLNDGIGGFTTGAGTVIGSEGDSTLSVALADVDGDGDLDLMAGNNGASKIYLNGGSGGFPDSSTAGTAIDIDSDNTLEVTLGDVDGDGDLDLVTGNDGQTNKLYLNDGSGGFPTVGTAIGSESDDTQSVTLADIDGDGNLDLVTGNDGQTNKLYINNGRGGFPTGAGTAIGSEADGTWSITLGDIDGDGDLDLVAGNKGQTNKLYLNDVTSNGSGNGGFTAGAGTAIGSDSDNTRSVTLGDIDGDGDLDLVTGNRGQINKLYLLSLIHI